MLQEITDIRLTLRPGQWPFAEDMRPKIEANWAARIAANPHLWNGRVLGTVAPGLPGGVSIEDGVLTGDVVEGDFASFVAWRDWGFPEVGMRNLFGSALIVSADNALILGVMASTTVNAGRIYPPGGSLEPADVGPDGRVGVIQSIERELMEETGLAAAEATVGETLVAFDGPRISIGRVLRFAEDAGALIERIMGNLDRQEERELERVIAIRTLDDAALPSITDYSRAFAARLFAR